MFHFKRHQRTLFLVSLVFFVTTALDLEDHPVVDDVEGGAHLSEDEKALHDALVRSGGAAGAVPAKIELPENPEPTKPDFWGHPIYDPCKEWAYEYTKGLPGGKIRHEHAVVRYPGTDHQVLDVKGFYAQIGTDGSAPFVTEYFKQGRNKTRFWLQVNCKKEEWDVMKCSPCLFEDYVIYGSQSPSCKESGTPSPTVLDGSNRTLESVVGVEGLARFAVPDRFSAKALLGYFGGLPGHVTNYSTSGNKIEPAPEPQDPAQRPLPDAPRSSWLYDYRSKRLPYAIRFEHAARRFQDTPQEFLDIRGILYWRSSNGDFRVQYIKDDTGFKVTMESADCHVTRGLWRCLYPKNGPSPSCGAGFSPGLLASLIGTG